MDRRAFLKFIGIAPAIPKLVVTTPAEVIPTEAERPVPLRVVNPAPAIGSQTVTFMSATYWLSSP